MAEIERIRTDQAAPQGAIGARPYWVLKLSILIRAVHQVGAAVFLASYLLDTISGPPLFYLVLAFTSGGALLLMEGMRHRQLYRELTGITTVVKLLLLGAAFHGLLPATAAVLLTFLLAAVSAHLPKKIRHRLLY